MQLIIILLIAVSILTLLSGVSVLLGARRGERVSAFLFFLATFFALGWAVFVGAFLGLKSDTPLSTAKTIIYIYYICAPLMCWALMSYACHEFKFGKICMGVFGAVCLTLIYFILTRGDLLYRDINLSEVTGNTVSLQQNLFNVIYGAYHFITVLLYMVGLVVAIRKNRSDNIKKANLMVLVGFGVTGAIALLFNFILPAMGKYDTIWVGPLAMSFAWVFHYYAVLKYRLLDLAGGWLKALSYIIIMSLAAIVYLAIFFIIFFSLFRVSNPSMGVIMLNIIMITVVILLYPVLGEVAGYVRSLVDVHSVDLVYIVKKLSVVGKEYINYPELVEFLAEHLHYQYIGIIVDGKLYGSKAVKLGAGEVKNLEKARARRGVWVELGGELEKAAKTAGIEGVAELRNSNSETVGKILFGRPLGGINFNSRDLSEVETALTLVAVAISTEKAYK